ncbi:MAG: DUF2281 domain-containing protein [Saprospiraceae bacterium]|nr:DUF2281 domain-containing protein [Saprospiraceae bacterium]
MRPKHFFGLPDSHFSFLAPSRLRSFNFLGLPIHQSEPKPKKRGGYGSLKGKIWMSPDFDAPLDDMKEYMG